MPTQRIESLTGAQRSQLTDLVHQWTQIAHSTAPADRPRAESAIAQMYKVAGLPPPGTIVWCGLPLGLVLTRAIAYSKLGNSIGTTVTDSVWWRLWPHARHHPGPGVDR